MRPIDSAALKIHVCEMCDDGQRECKGDKSCAILCWINDMPTIEHEPVRWILTKDRLPDKPGRYLAYAERTIYCNHNEIADEEYRTNVLYFDGKEWTDLESICYDVIRWMPIPEYRTS